MLTLEMLYALLQGLPADHLDHLDRAWYLLAVRIERGLKEGRDPVSALYEAFDNSHDWERQHYLRALLQEEPVLALPDLTQRQKEALIALRYSGACSLSQLSRILAQDRGNTSRRLDVLIEKGYAVKYFRRDGPYYLAITSPLGDQVKSQVADLMQAFKQALLEDSTISNAKPAPGHKSPAPFPLYKGEGTGLGVSIGSAKRSAISPTPSTTHTTPTKATTPTNATSESRYTKHTTPRRLPRPP
jgi:DNA-binding MarR family transcriptional regulator